jgi:hypothetical protein
LIKILDSFLPRLEKMWMWSIYFNSV